MSHHFAIATTAKGVLEQVQLPTPQPGPGNVLIKVHYAALIPFDTYQLDRGYLVSDYPHVLSIASAGVVKAVGEGVTDLKEGDKVNDPPIPAELCANAIPGLCIQLFGKREQSVARVHSGSPLPRGQGQP